MKFKTITLMMSLIIALSVSLIFANESYAKACSVTKSCCVEACCCKQDCSCCKCACENCTCEPCKKQDKNK